MKEIHVRLKVIIHGSDITPVFFDLITVDTFHILITDQNIFHEIVSVFFCTSFDHLDQLPSSDYIDTAGDRVGPGHHRLLLEFLYAALLVHLDRSVPVHIDVRRHILTYNSDIRLLLNMVLQKLIIVHFVNAVTGRYYHVWFMAVFQERKVLCNGICCTTIPCITLCCQCRSENTQPTLLTTEIPPFGRT